MQLLDGGIGLTRLLHRAGDVQAIAGWQLRAHPGQGLPEGGGDVIGLGAPHVGLHRQERLAVEALDDRVLEADLDAPELADRHLGAVLGQDLQLVQAVGGQALTPAGAAGDDLDAADVLAQLGDGPPFELGLQLLRHVPRREAEQVQTLHFHSQVQDRGALVPLQMRIDHLRVGGHYRPHPVGDVPQYQRVRADDPKAHRPDHRRPIEQPVHPHPRLGKVALGDVLAQGRYHLVAGLGIRRHGDELGEGRVGGLRIGGDEEARRPRPDVGRQASDLGQWRQDGLQPLHRPLGGGDAAALGQIDANHHLRTIGAREELLLDQQGHAGDGEDQQGDRGPDHRLAPGDAPGDEPAQPAVEGGLVEGLRAVRPTLDAPRQHLDPQIGDEHHRHQPGQDEGDGQDPEDVAGVLADARLGEADGEKPGDGHQGAEEHRRGGDRPGMTGRGHALPALLHLHQHHLHRDDGVVHQQAEGDDQGAQGDAVEIDAHQGHHQKGQPQGEGDGDAHHQPGAQADGQHAHRHHHGHGDQELDLKQVHRPGDGLRLVGQDRERHAQGQPLAFSVKESPKPLPQRQPILALVHHHPQQHRVLSARAHQVAGGVLVAAADGRQVGELEHPVADAYRHRGQSRRVGQVRVQPQIEARAGGLQAPGRQQVVIGLDGGEDRLWRDPQIVQPGGVELDVDPFGALAQHQGLAHPRHPLQPIPQPLGLTGQLAHRQAGGGEGDQAEIDVRKVVIDEGPDDPRRQVARLVQQALAHLIEEVGDPRLGRRVEKLDLQAGLAGADGGLDAVEVLNLLDAFLQPVHHLGP